MIHIYIYAVNRLWDTDRISRLRRPPLKRRAITHFGEKHVKLGAGWVVGNPYLGIISGLPVTRDQSEVDSDVTDYALVKCGFFSNYSRAAATPSCGPTSRHTERQPRHSLHDSHPRAPANSELARHESTGVQLPRPSCPRHHEEHRCKERPPDL
jgi:hypothetical protein